ncbi:MAG: xylitol oxidase, partial [Micrococcales bacterium]|nr:xylitol oxidase [Micrococcales bacterium]
MGEQNWAGNLTYRAEAVQEPANLGELVDIVTQTPRVRALGSRHSFSPIADTEGALVSLARMPRQIEID